MFMSYAIYVISMKRQPYYGSMLLGVAISIKAPAILIVPAYLGTIQYIFGIKHLVLSVVIIIGI